MHEESSPLARTTVRIREDVKHPQYPEFGGAEFHVEDWWDRLGGKSWMDCDGNPACLIYAVRSANADPRLPLDNEVLYGKVGHFGSLVHVSELEV